jgi:hypothetical protein
MQGENQNVATWKFVLDNRTASQNEIKDWVTNNFVAK